MASRALPPQKNPVICTMDQLPLLFHIVAKT